MRCVWIRSTADVYSSSGPLQLAETASQSLACLLSSVRSASSSSSFFSVFFLPLSFARLFLFYFIFRPSYSLSLFLSHTTYILSIPSAFFRFFLLFFFLPHAAGMPVDHSNYVHLQIVHRWRRPRAAALTIQNEGNGVW